MINTRLKIVIVLVISLISSVVISKTVFLSNTPRINPQFARLIRNLPNTSTSFIAQLYSLFHPSNINITNSQQFFSTLPKTIVPTGMTYQPLTKGVYAAEDKKNNVKYIKVEKGKQVEVREYSIKLKNGQNKIIKILIPLN